jgi:acyl-CoA hydrolase
LRPLAAPYDVQHVSSARINASASFALRTKSGVLYSGIGGQMDFIRGAARPAGGKPI